MYNLLNNMLAVQIFNNIIYIIYKSWVGLGVYDFSSHESIMTRGQIFQKKINPVINLKPNLNFLN